MKSKLLLLLGVVANMAFAQQAEPLPVPQIAKMNFYEKGAMTFYAGQSTPFIQNILRDSLTSQLKFDFPNIAFTVNAPSAFGYQYHVKDRWSIGIWYSTSSVKSNDLDYPDFQNPSQSTKYNLEVRMNTLMATVDYYWFIQKRPKSTIAMHSGLALGTMNYSIKTNIISGNGKNLPQVNYGLGSEAMQITLVGIKHTMSTLRGWGWFSNLGLGMNTVGFTAGINKTL